MSGSDALAYGTFDLPWTPRERRQSLVQVNIAFHCAKCKRQCAPPESICHVSGRDGTYSGEGSKNRAEYSVWMHAEDKDIRFDEDYPLGMMMTKVWDLNAGALKPNPAKSFLCQQVRCQCGEWLGNFYPRLIRDDGDFEKNMVKFTVRLKKTRAEQHSNCDLGDKVLLWSIPGQQIPPTKEALLKLGYPAGGEDAPVTILDDVEKKMKKWSVGEEQVAVELTFPIVEKVGQARVHWYRGVYKVLKMYCERHPKTWNEKGWSNVTWQLLQAIAKLQNSSTEFATFVCDVARDGMDEGNICKRLMQVFRCLGRESREAHTLFDEVNGREVADASLTSAAFGKFDEVFHMVDDKDEPDSGDMGAVINAASVTAELEKAIAWLCLQAPSPACVLPLQKLMKQVARFCRTAKVVERTLPSLAQLTERRSPYARLLDEDFVLRAWSLALRDLSRANWAVDLLPMWSRATATASVREKRQWVGDAMHAVLFSGIDWARSWRTLVSLAQLVPLEESGKVKPGPSGIVLFDVLHGEDAVNAILPVCLLRARFREWVMAQDGARCGVILGNDSHKSAGLATALVRTLVGADKNTRDFKRVEARLEATFEEKWQGICAEFMFRGRGRGKGGGKEGGRGGGKGGGRGGGSGGGRELAKRGGRGGGGRGGSTQS